MSASTVCIVPGCPRLATYRGRCAAHRVRYRETTRAQRQQRAIALRRDRHRCVDCGARAVLTHHVTPYAEGGSDEAHNLVSLCTECHAARHGVRAPA